MESQKTERTLLVEVSRDEHRTLRDAVVNLVRAFEEQDLSSARFFVNNLTQLAGPHFRFEEETLYPALRAVLSDQQVRDLLNERDRVITAIRTLRALADKQQISERDGCEGADLAQSIITSVSSCDGLSLLAERLSDLSIREALNAWRHAKAENLDLFQWADTVRPPRQWELNTPSK